MLTAPLRATPVRQNPRSTQRRLPRSSDWGIGMTVCVGAVNAWGEIVTASDRMLTMSQGAFSGDQAADKTDILCENWLVMYAAEDVGVVPSLLRRIQNQLAQLNDEPSADQMMVVLRDAFQAERRERAAELYLSSF